MATYYKDVDAVLDFGIDWSSWLDAGETISTSTYTVGTGITKDSDSNTTTASTVWLSGGTEGSSYIITNEIVTSDSRTDQRSFTVKVVER